MYKRYLIILLLFIAGQCFALAAIQESLDAVQEVVQFDKDPISSSSLDKETIENYKNDQDYDYSEIEPEDNWLSRLRLKLSDIWNSFLRWLTGGENATGFFAIFLEILPFLFLAFLLGLLIWVFLKIDNARGISQTKLAKVLIGDDEEIINNQDIQSLINEALKEKNYRLAIRYYYLLTLQQLSGKELIDWQVQKTNHEYIYEIKNNDLRSQFGQLTDVYDYIWYGNFEVDETAFAKAQLAFNKMNSEI